MIEPENEPVSIIFLSCDLTGSTKYKQRQDLREPWQKAFLQFYREFPQRVAMTQVELGTDLDFRLWKPIGDELIYSCVVRTEADVYDAVRVWLKAMRDYESQSLDDTDMGTKGGAFIATFPGPDSRSSVPRSPDSEVSDRPVITLNREALKLQNNDAFVYDYFGPSIDTGFRVIGKCTPRYFTLSVEVALAILGLSVVGTAAGGTDVVPNTDNFLLREFVELKGVWGEKPYPVVAIDTRHDDPVNQAYSAFERRGTVHEIYGLVKACYDSYDISNPPSQLYLPGAVIDHFKRAPGEDPLQSFIEPSAAGAEQLADDEPEDASDDLGDDLDFGMPHKSEISEGFLLGDDQIHGYVPDGNVLCGGLGDGGSDPYLPPDSCNSGGPDYVSFDPGHRNACVPCADVWNGLPD